MMNKYSMVFLILMGLSFQSQSQGITFEQDTTLADVLVKARKANKPIFIDYYFTGCSPCKWMERNVFSNDTVGEYMNKNFVSIKLNLDKGDGKKVAAKYNVYGGPTFLFLDTAGSEIHRFGWAMPAKEFIMHAQKAFDPQYRLTVLQDIYNKGERDPAFFCKYLLSLREAGDTGAVKMSDAYFASLPENELVTKGNFDLMEKTILEMEQPGFNKLLMHYKAFGEVAGRERVNAKINKVYSKCFKQVFMLNPQKQQIELNKQKYTGIINTVKALDYEGKEDIVALLELQYLSRQEDSSAYIAAAKRYVPLYFWNDAWDLQNHVSHFCRVADKKEDLEMAYTWSRRSLELYDDHDFNDNHASLCQKLGRKEEALQHVQKAVEQAKEDPWMLKIYEEHLKEISKM